MRHVLIRQQLHDLGARRIQGGAPARYLRRGAAQAMREARHPLAGCHLFPTTLPADQIAEEASAIHAFVEWARQRLGKMDAQLQLAMIAAEISGMDAFAPEGDVDSYEG